MNNTTLSSETCEPSCSVVSSIRRSAGNGESNCDLAPCKMKIVHISKNDLAGGAARAAYRLHKGLQRIGQESAMFVESRYVGVRSGNDAVGAVRFFPMIIGVTF